MSKFNKESELEPSLVRIKRTRGEIIQPCDLYISKECCASGWMLSQSKWYNREAANDPEEYISYLKSKDELCGSMFELVGQSLGCWCSGTKAKSCHGKVLIGETKKFLKEYFEKVKKENRSLDRKKRKDDLKMEIVPLEKYNLKVSSRKHKKYKLVFDDGKCDTGTSTNKSPASLQQPQQQPKPLKSCVKRRKMDSVQEEKITWNEKTKEWILPEHVSLDEDMRLTNDAVLGFDRGLAFDLKKGDKLTINGRIDVFNILDKNKLLKHIEHQKEQYLKYVNRKNPIDFDRDYTVKLKNKVSITQSAVGDLFSGKRGIYDQPFVCKVEARLFNKKTNRFMLKVFDGVASYKVQLGSQLFRVIEEQLIDKEDLIQVIDYTNTSVTSRKRIVFFHSIKKVIC